MIVNYILLHYILTLDKTITKNDMRSSKSSMRVAERLCQFSLKWSLINSFDSSCLWWSTYVVCFSSQTPLSSTVDTSSPGTRRFEDLDDADFRPSWWPGCSSRCSAVVGSACARRLYTQLRSGPSPIWLCPFFNANYRATRAKCASLSRYENGSRLFDSRVIIQAMIEPFVYKCRIKS